MNCVGGGVVTRTLCQRLASVRKEMRMELGGGGGFDRGGFDGDGWMRVDG